MELADKTEGSTFLTKAIINVLKEPSTDTNCDGIVSDHELFQGVTGFLHHMRIHDKKLRYDPFFPDPKLRRQATSYLPMYKTIACNNTLTQNPEKMRKKIRKLIKRLGDSELAMALNDQIKLEHRPDL